MRAGWATISLSGAKAGTALEVHYSDKINSKGEVDSSGCCIPGQIQTDFYISNGTGTVGHPEVFTPRFAYMGFQYVELSGPGGAALPQEVKVNVDSVQEVRTNLPATGSFTSSNPRLNKLEQIVRASIAANYVAGIITDTPEYEKNAWTGDAQLTAPTASDMFNTEWQFRKNFQDMKDMQGPTGELTLLAPGAPGYGHVDGAFKPGNCCGATPIWDAFWFVLPWESYMRYGDVRGLQQAYPIMKKYLDEWIPQWVNKDGDDSPYTLTSGLGDWDPPTGSEGTGPTAVPVPAAISSASTAYYAYLVHIAADSARAIGNTGDAAEFDALFRKIRDAYNDKWWDAKLGYYHEATTIFYQGPQVISLALDLAPAEARAGLQKKLVNDVVNTRAGHEEVGIVGTRWILPVQQGVGGGYPRGKRSGLCHRHSDDLSQLRVLDGSGLDRVGRIVGKDQPYPHAPYVWTGGAVVL